MSTITSVGQKQYTPEECAQFSNNELASKINDRLAAMRQRVKESEESQPNKPLIPNIEATISKLGVCDVEETSVGSTVTIGPDGKFVFGPGYSKRIVTVQRQKAIALLIENSDFLWQHGVTSVRIAPK